MNVLAFDTCFAACSAAVGTGVGMPEARVTNRYEPMQTGHAERLVAMIDEVVTEAGITLGAIDRLGVTIGPGSFVGTRVGVSAARALAMALKVPVITATSLEVMARGAARMLDGTRDICVTVDMRREEVYAQLFDATGVARSAPMVLGLADAAHVGNCLLIWGKPQRHGQPVYFVGTGAEAVAEMCDDPTRSAALPFLLPDAKDFILAMTGRENTTKTAAPLYLRPPDAKPPTSGQLERR